MMPETRFLPAERTDVETLSRQIQSVASAPEALRQLLDLVSDALLVLNNTRQIVFANERLAALSGVDRAEALIGKRVGEAIQCSHADEEEGGCGTCESCRVCGAALAIVTAQLGKDDERECRIIRGAHHEAVDLRVRTAPLEVSGEHFTLFTATDISHEKRRRRLEQAFFHDVLNTMTGMRIAVESLSAGDPEESGVLYSLLDQLTRDLEDEIRFHETLAIAERGELEARHATIRPDELIDRIADRYRALAERAGCTLKVVSEAGRVDFHTDPFLLRLVLGQMITNAIEASGAGEEITLEARVRAGRILFSVHNAGSMSRRVQLQVFQRSFSTREPGRGVGTYSMQLFSRRYLGGRVFFETSRESGTTFYAEYPLHRDPLELRRNGD